MIGDVLELGGVGDLEKKNNNFLVLPFLYGSTVRQRYAFLGYMVSPISPGKQPSKVN